MPLYRRGPGFSAPGLYDADWPAQHSYGPPADDGSRGLASAKELDLKLFSVYFLVAESLATFVGYRITQHCLRGCRVRFLSPTQRMIIGMFYCWFKIKLIDYAFHDSVYFKFSLLTMVVYFVYALLAFGFHSGPLQFLFFDYIPRSKMTQSLIYKLALLCKQISERAEFYVLQRLICLPPLETRRPVVAPSANADYYNSNARETEMAAAEANGQTPEEAAKAAAVAYPLPTGFSRVSSFFGREVDVKIDLWNRSLCQQWAMALSSTGRTSAMRVRDHRDPTCTVFESRFLFVLQHDGLLLGFFMTNPTATLMAKFRDGQATPFELLLRYHCSSRGALSDVQPVFLYAESPRLVGRATSFQKSAVFRLLTQLNAAHNHAVDVPLRSLRAKNFVQAGVGQVVKKKARAQRSFSELDDAL